MNAPDAIHTRALGRDYGKTVALRSCDLRVAPGTLLGILGPNGAGKTTTMLLLATLLTPSRGGGHIFGHDLARERARIRRRLGLVFQEPSIDGLLTVRENLAFAAGLMGLGGNAARQAVDEAIARAGLGSQSAKPARQLSGGWRRLTDIARATLHRPDLLILDEPTVGLDPEHRDRMWNLLDAERRERGVTIVFSTHYLTEAESCDRVLMLTRGEVVADDTPSFLMAGIGSQVVELEGPDAELAVSALSARTRVTTSVRTERGWRLGVSESSQNLAAIAAAAPRLTRLDVRDVSLEDVYFAMTRTGDAVAASPYRASPR
jgi:ABC-2 type transport system ATP-binding protein